MIRFSHPLMEQTPASSFASKNKDTENFSKSRFSTNLNEVQKDILRRVDFEKLHWDSGLSLHVGLPLADPLDALCSPGDNIVMLSKMPCKRMVRGFCFGT